MRECADNKRVLILDISSGGHHPTYIRWLLEAGVLGSSRIVLAAHVDMFAHPEIIASPQQFEAYPIRMGTAFEARLADFRAVSLVRMSWSIGRLYRQVFRAVERSGRVDFVIVPFLDDCLVGLSLPDKAFGGVPWLAITMRTMFHYPEMGVEAEPQKFTAFRRYLLGRVLKQPSLRALLTIDPTLVAFAESRSAEFQGKIVHLPDPSTFHPRLPTRTYARTVLGIPEEAPLIVLYGEISARKGVTALLEAAADPLCGSRLHVILAGRCRDRDQLISGAAFKFLKAAGRLQYIDHYVSGEEEGQLLAAADCFWLGYTGFYGMSGIMVLAGRHGVPVLASREGLIGYLAKKHVLGAVVDPLDKASIIGALNSMARDVDDFRKAGRNGAKLFENHDPVAFQRIVTGQIASALGPD
jgi:glycosyltransferase involved in cell wall biosynthesis